MAVVDDKEREAAKEDQEEGVKKDDYTETEN